MISTQRRSFCGIEYGQGYFGPVAKEAKAVLAQEPIPEGALSPDVVCAIIPAYNEAKSIATIIQQTKQYVSKVYVIDDCSTDDTAEIARQHGAEVIQHSVNGGPGAALQSGCNTAAANGFKYIVQVDGDGQHDPKYIPEMLKIAQICDMVIASRFLNKSHKSYPLVRRLGISFFTRLVNLLTQACVTDVTSGYRVFRTESLNRLNPALNRHWAIAQTMEAANKGLRIKEVSAEMPVRNEGKSQFSLLTYCLYPLRMSLIVLRFSLIR